MKKFVIGLLVSIMLAMGVVASAENGNIAGYIYSTDILAFVNGEPIEGYNIGGRTVIIAEELDNYGFYCSYDDAIRTLNIESYFSNGKNIADIPRNKTGQIVGNIYTTDIKVFFNGIEIQGYNLGGKTAICIEDMGDLTASPNAEYGYSKYLGKAVWSEQERTISFESFKRNQAEIMGNLARVSYTFLDNVLYAYPDEWSKWLELRPINENPAFSFAEAIDNNYSKGFEKDIIAPLYIDVAGEKTQVGLAVENPNSELDTLLHFFDSQKALELTSRAKAPQKSYNEAMEYFLQKYKIVNRLDNDHYTVLHINDAMDGVLFVYINKTGGFVIDDFFKGYGDYEVKIWFKEDGQNIVGHSVYPFAGPHGATTMQYESELDSFDYE